MTNAVDYATLEFGLGDRLAKALTVANMNGLEMADFLGVSRQTIGNYTSGRTRPNRATLRTWALRTGVPLSWIETGTLPGGPNKSPSDYKSSSSHPVTPLFTGRSLTGVSQIAA